MGEESVHDLCDKGLKRAEPLAVTGIWPKPANRVEEYGLSDLRQRLAEKDKRIAFLEEQRASAQRMYAAVCYLNNTVMPDTDRIQKTNQIVDTWQGVFERDEGK